uniref:Dynamin N-terminal domain-containing protein n=1 Tax=Bionectria ochroleuca TaxID=29856 RepID=A0A8H7NFF3_BIOOC
MDFESSESPQRFAWQTCATPTEDAESLSIREDAVAKAEAHATKLISCLEDRIDDQSPDSRNVMKSILNSLFSIREEHKGFEMLVGVAGATGAGKSSMLNALLGFREIFPSGHQGAATAVPCKVAWNFDDRPGYECIANIYFQSKEEVMKTLEILAEAFISRDNPDETSFQSDKEKEDNLEQMQSEINKGMEKVRAVWKLEEEDVQGIIDSTCSKVTSSANLIFDSNPAVGELLKLSMKTVHASTPEELADLTKPYLDSTEASHGSGANFAAWPLVKEVRLFLRVSLLKNGLCLVDLPGQGEMEASRAEVAQRYSDKLDVTMIVAPVHRAADERIAQKLLNKFHSLQMEMDGRFNKEKFSVILSKTDQIEADDYTALYGQDEEVRRLKGAIQIARQEKRNRPNSRRQRKLQSRAKTLMRYFKKASLKNKKIRTEEKDLVIGQKPKKTEIRGKSMNFNSSVNNKLLAKALLRKIKAWKERAKKTNKQSDLEIRRLDHQLSHWAIWNRNRHVVQWMHKAISRSREKHLLLILNKYLVVFNKLQAWTKNPNKSDPGMDKAEIEDRLNKSHQKFLKDLESIFDTLCKKIEAFDTLRNIHPIKFKFKRESEYITETWSFKDPKSPFRRTIHWSTYRAIVVREGYWKHPDGIEYNWILDLATPLLEILKENWQGVSKESLLRLRTDVETKIIDAWKGDAVEKIDWKLREQLIGILPEMTAIGTSLCSQMSSLLDGFAKKVNGLHCLIVPNIENALRPVLNEALQFQGLGSHARRQHFVAENVPLQCERLVPMLCQSIRFAFHGSLAEVKRDSMKKALEAIEEAKAQFNIHARVLSNNGLSAGELNKDLDQNLKQDVSIPEKVTIEHIMSMEEAYRDLFGDGPMAQTDSEESESESDTDRDSDAPSSETNQDEEMPLADDVSMEDLEMELKNLEKQRKKR